MEAIASVIDYDIGIYSTCIYVVFTYVIYLFDMQLYNKPSRKYQYYRYRYLIQTWHHVSFRYFISIITTVYRLIDSHSRILVLEL